MNKMKNTCLLFLLAAGPGILDACPRCVDATPYKTGMQLAVIVLLPVPAILATLLFLWVRKESRGEGSDS